MGGHGGKDKPLRRRFGKGSSKSSANVEDLTEERFGRSPMDIDKLAWFLFFAVPLTVSILIGYFYYKNMMYNIVVTPLAVERVITSERTTDMSKFWGTYRPGVYFGTKTRSANSPVTGLMWFEQSLPREPSIRHWCEQGDNLKKYGWLQHNGIDFGVQQIEDINLTIKTEFVKQNGGEHGGDWSARVSATPTQQYKKGALTSLIYYFATDGQTAVHPQIKDHKLLSLEGKDDELGRFSMNFRSQSETTKFDHMISYAPQFKDIVHVMKFGFEMRNFRGGQYLGLKGRLVPLDSPGPNLFIYQVTGTLPLTLEVTYESASFTNRSSSLTNTQLSKAIEKRSMEFDDRFEQKFGLKAKNYSKEAIDFAKAALSNMIGGIGHFFGSSVVQSAYNPDPVAYWEAPLYTAVPSRSFFPRGFLWDEGFHNLLIREWDEEISMDIIGHWMDLMNTEGWIPREQILDSEARAKVPKEFMVQRNENANPPTFFLPLEKIIENLINVNDTTSHQYLTNIFPRLRTWYNWFNRTQTGPVPYSYRWRGRNPDAVKELNPKTLTSGLDDYPRASHPTDEEMHLDLRCWMALASKVMANIAKGLGQPWEVYQYTYEKLSDNNLLNELHWSSKAQRYADYGLHTDGTKLQRPPPPPTHQPGQPIPHRDKERVVTKEPIKRLVSGYYGYVSLFPFLTQILDPSSKQLEATLRDMRDEKLLWTKFGLRSLARTSPLYQKHNTEHDPPYWRGAIWINMNYLAIRSLYHYSHVEGPFQTKASQLYAELKENVVNNILAVYQRTGYIWEQYDDNTGNGKGCHPFTGWSALVTLIMAEKY